MAPKRVIATAVVSVALSTVVALPRLVASAGPGPVRPASAVALEDDDVGAAMFDGSLLSPERSLQRCIAVTYTGNDSPVDLSLSGSVADAGLAGYLDLVVETGGGGGFGDCRDFAPTETVFAGTLQDFSAEAVDGIRQRPFTASPQTRSYRFTVTLHDDNGAQGKTAAATFTWRTTFGG